LPFRHGIASFFAALMFERREPVFPYSRHAAIFGQKNLLIRFFGGRVFHRLPVIRKTVQNRFLGVRAMRHRRFF
jgi:hypothetical protein